MKKEVLYSGDKVKIKTRNIIGTIVRAYIECDALGSTVRYEVETESGTVDIPHYLANHE